MEGDTNSKGALQNAWTLTHRPAVQSALPGLFKSAHTQNINDSSLAHLPGSFEPEETHNTYGSRVSDLPGLFNSTSSHNNNIDEFSLALQLNTLSGTRVLNDSETFEGRAPTSCFEDVMLEHPHHHILECGHMVVTKTPMACGLSCERSLFADGKMEGRSILCMVSACWKIRYTEALSATKRKTEIRRDGVLVAYSRRPRENTLIQGAPSHVYGMDLEADQARIQQKTAELRISKAYSTSKALIMDERLRDRTASPEPKDMSTLHNADEERKQPAGDDDLVILGSSSVKRKASPSPEEEERNVKRLIQSLLKAKKTSSFLSIGGEVTEGRTLRPLHHRIKYSAHAKPTILEHDKREQHNQRPWTNNQGGLAGVYSSHDSVSADVIERIHSLQAGVYVEVEDHISSRLPRNLEDSAIQTYDEVPDIGERKHCVCRSTDTSLMVKCELCEHLFHPGCIGKGHQSRLSYQSIAQYMAWKCDFNDFRGGRRILGLYCTKCDKIANKHSTCSGIGRKKLLVKRAAVERDDADEVMASAPLPADNDRFAHLTPAEKQQALWNELDKKSAADTKLQRTKASQKKAKSALLASRSGIVKQGNAKPKAQSHGDRRMAHIHDVEMVDWVEGGAHTAGTPT